MTTVAKFRLHNSNEGRFQCLRKYAAKIVDDVNLSFEQTKQRQEKWKDCQLKSFAKLEATWRGGDFSCLGARRR